MFVGLPFVGYFQDLNALAFHIQVEQRTRRRPEVQVDFQSISGELIERRDLEKTEKNFALGFCSVELCGCFVCHLRVVESIQISYDIILCTVCAHLMRAYIFLFFHEFHLCQRLHTKHLSSLEFELTPPLSPKGSLKKNRKESINTKQT